MHAVRNGTAPTYIRDLVAHLICGRLHLDISTYREPGKSSDQGHFRLWLLLHGTVPASIRELTSRPTNSFKRQLKTHLFRVAYEPAV